MTLWQLLKRILVSWTNLPLWVNVWVFGFLGPVNIATLFFLNTDTGFYGAIAMAFAFAGNGYLILANGGVSKVMSIPHLIAWVPLVLWLLWKLVMTETIVPGSGEYWLAWGLVVINGISLGFDIFDTKEWRAGNRAIIGFPDVKPRY